MVADGHRRRRWTFVPVSPNFDVIIEGREQKMEKPVPFVFYHCCDRLRVQYLAFKKQNIDLYLSLKIRLH
jgi:beta-phosphoglucomutase-like phosphatase (HAD superfamily)